MVVIIGTVLLHGCELIVVVGECRSIRVILMRWMLQLLLLLLLLLVVLIIIIIIVVASTGRDTVLEMLLLSIVLRVLMRR